MKLTAQTLAAQALQARIALSDEQAARLLPQLNAMLDGFEALNDVDTTGVEPLVQVYPFRHTMRADEVRQSFSRAALLANAPKKTDEAFVVPKTVE